jgi:hypothetical protein
VLAVREIAYASVGSTGGLPFIELTNEHMITVN